MLSEVTRACELVVGLHKPVIQGIGIEVVPDLLTAETPHLGPSVRMINQEGEAVGEGVHVALRNEKT